MFLINVIFYITQIQYNKYLVGTLYTNGLEF